MKFLILILSLFFIQGIAKADSSQTYLVPVSNLIVTADVGGCPPSGGPCVMPVAPHVTFMVASGGSCHSYEATVIKNGGSNYLNILDTSMPNCTRPEIQNFSVTVNVKNVRPGETDLNLANPIYVISKKVTSF